MQPILPGTELPGLVGLSLAALVFTVLAIAGSAALARRTGLLLDHATGRKRHHGAIPLVGGPVLAVLLLAALLALDWPMREVWPLALGIVVLAGMGVIDDLVDLPAWPRLLVQALVVSVAVFVGDNQLHFIGDLFGMGRIGLGPLAPFFTILCLLFLINALNMLDGMDGLLGTTTLVSAAALALLGRASGMPSDGLFAALLSAGLLGFLLFNLRSPWRRKASVYLGDSGSMMLGFVIGWLAITAVETSNGRISPVTIALILLFPAADALAAFIRRIRAGRNPMQADRSHLHHLLTRAGLSVGQSWSILVSGHLLWVTIAIAAHAYRLPEAFQFAVALVAVTAYILIALQGPRLIRAGRQRGRRQT